MFDARARFTARNIATNVTADLVSLVTVHQKKKTYLTITKPLLLPPRLFIPPFQSINQFVSRHSTEARATVRLCRIYAKCLKTDLKCVNGWSSSTVQWKRVPKSRSSNRETMSSSVEIVRRNWQKLLCG